VPDAPVVPAPPVVPAAPAVPETPPEPASEPPPLPGLPELPHDRASAKVARATKAGPEERRCRIMLDFPFNEREVYLLKVTVVSFLRQTLTVCFSGSVDLSRASGRSR
jgi:hypothetical protein